MTVTHVLAVVPVRDFDASRAWYEEFFGRPPTNVPMPGILAEWQVVDGGWVQVTAAAESAGTAMVNLAVDDLERHRAELASRGLIVGDIQRVNKGVELGTIHDPDGNTITFIGNFREVY